MGTDTPAFKADIIDDGANQTLLRVAHLASNTAPNTFAQLENYYGSTTIPAGAHLRLVFARGTQASPSAVADGDRLGSLIYSGWDGSTFQNPAAVFGKVVGSVSAGNVPAKLTFETGGCFSGCANPRAERMVVLPNGNVGIGTSSPNEQLELTGNLRLPPSTDTTGIIKSGADRFIHNFGSANFFAGVNAGNLSMSGGFNTGVGGGALFSNTTGTNNTAIGRGANVSSGALTNATAIGNLASVNASNKVRIGDTNVTVIEGQVDWTFTSDRTQKENFLSLPGKEVLQKLSLVPVHSWNYLGQDPKQFRHYGPNAQDFFTQFGRDGLGTIGTERTLTGSDVDGILMVSIQALYELSLKKDQQIEELEKRIEKLERLVEQLTQKK